MSTTCMKISKAAALTSVPSLIWRGREGQREGGTEGGRDRGREGGREKTD